MKNLISDKQLAKIFDALKTAAHETAANVYLVGGAVRDILLGKKPDDLDFTVFNYPYEAFAKNVAQRLGRRAIFFKQNVRIPYKNTYFDISEPRGGTLAEDISLRDFTINNLAFSLDGELIGDATDLNKRLIRPVHDRSLDDDPLRILRGFRQAAVLGFNMSAEFLAAAKVKRGLLSKVAAERKGAELRKLVVHPNKAVYATMHSLHIWQELLGTALDVVLLMKAAQAAEHFTPEEGFALFLAVAGNEAFRKAAKELALSSNELKYAKLLLNARLDIENISQTVWQYRNNIAYILTYFRLIGADEALILAHEQEHRQMDFAAAELISGEDILRLAGDKRAGKWFADLLNDTKIKLATGVLNSREEAIEYMRLKI